MTFSYKRFSLLSGALFYSVFLFGQESTDDFYSKPNAIDEVVQLIGSSQSDTVALFFNDHWRLVRPKCAAIFRISRIDLQNGIYTGSFVDYYLPDSLKALEGNYVDGKLDGKLSRYYRSGELAEEGEYKQGKKIGIWDYYYESCIKKQTFQFLADEIKILEFYDEEGDTLTYNGNGIWYGFESNWYFKASGQVQNGSKTGD